MNHSGECVGVCGVCVCVCVCVGVCGCVCRDHLSIFNMGKRVSENLT